MHGTKNLLQKGAHGSISLMPVYLGPLPDPPMTLMPQWQLKETRERRKEVGNLEALAIYQID